MAYKASPVNQIFSNNKLRANQSQIDDSLTKSAFKKANSAKASKIKSPNSLAAMIAKK